MTQHLPHKSNAPGDFYVEDGCCIACQVPFGAAPELFAWDDETDHCYVCRQPSTPFEQDQMVEAMGLSEVRCIRYGGSERVIQLQLIATGLDEQCDSLIPELRAKNELPKPSYRPALELHELAIHMIRRLFRRWFK